MPMTLRRAFQRMAATIMHPLWRFTKGATSYGRLIYEEGGTSSIGAMNAREYSIAPTPEDLFELFQQNVWLAAAIGAKARAVASAPWRVYKETDGPEDEVVKGHPAEKLLYDPDDGETWDQTAQRISTHMDVAGQAFLEIARADDGTPGRLSLLYPPRVTVVVERDKGIAGYDVRNAAETYPTRLAPEDVVYMRHPHPSIDFRGMGLAEAAKLSAQADTLGRRWNAKFFRRGAQPDTVLSSDMDIPKAERTAILDEWMAKHGGEKGRGVAMLPYGLKATVFGIAHREMQFRDLLRGSRDEIVAAEQVPPIMMGIREGANYATAYVEIELFRDQVLLPLLRAIFGPLTTGLLWSFPGAREEGLYFAPDVRAMQTPEEIKRSQDNARADHAQGLATRAEARQRLGYSVEPETMVEPPKKEFFAYELEDGVFTIDEARAVRGLGPHPDRTIGPLTVPQMRIKLGVTAAGNEIGAGSFPGGGPGAGLGKAFPPGGVGNGNGNGHHRPLLTSGARERVIKTLLLEAAEEGGSEDDDEGEAAGGARARLYIPYRMDKARRKAEDPIATKLEAEFARRLERQRDAVLALIRRKLKKAEGEDAAPRRTFTAAELMEAIGEPLTRSVRAQLKAAVASGGSLEADAAGIKFREADPALTDYLRTRETNLEHVLDETTADEVKAALAAGFEASESEEDLLRRVEGAGTFARSRARRIARTETHAAVMSGAHVAMKQSGATRKQWLAASDARPAHREASGQIVDIDEPFIVDGEELMYPGDPSGSPGNIIQCRCTTLVLRDETTAEELTEALDLTGDEDAVAQVEEAAGELEPETVARIPADDVERLRVAAGDGEQVEYDPKRHRLTVGPDAGQEDVANGVREHLVASLLTGADARGFLNIIATGELPEPKVKGAGSGIAGEIKRAVAAIARTVTGDREGLEALTGALDDEQWDAYRVAAQNFWISPANRAKAPVQR